MSTIALPASSGSGVDKSASHHGQKIIQRLLPLPGSHLSKAHRMADADEDLVLKSQSGDTTAFETLVREHQKMVHALTFRMTGSLADAEDLAQETFIRAFDQIERFNRKSKFSTWLYSIAVHACLNWRRSEARRYRAYEKCAEETMAEQAGKEFSQPEADIAGDAQAALMKLPPKQRAAVVLTIYDGLSHAEAAKVLHCSETTVSWRVFSAKRKLKRILSRSKACIERKQCAVDFEVV